MNKKISIILLFFIFVLGFFLRFYKLGEIPNGLYQDETAIGYNAYSILHTGRDEHNMPFPLYFKSFGDYKLPVYIYSTVVTVKIFGLTPFAVRLPSALFGFFTVVVLYFFVKELTKKESLSLIATFLLAINPWHLHYSRATFEVSISLFLFLSGTLLLLKSYKNNVNGAFFIGTLCFVIDIYTYNVTRLLSPVLYFLIVLHAPRKKSFFLSSEISLTVFLSLICLFPFIRTLFQTGGVASAKGTLIFSSAAVQAPLLELKSYFLQTPFFISKLLFNIPLLTVWQYLANVAAYFSIPFFFVTGSSHGNHGIGNVGQFYLFEFPLVIIGVYQASIKKYPWKNIVLLWGFFTIAIAGVTRDIPHATRSFFLIMPFEIFSSVGMLFIIEYILHIPKKKVRYAAGILLFLIAVYNIFYYFSSYYIRFPVLYAKQWRYADKELALYVGNTESKYDRIIFDTNSGFIYSSFLFYTQYAPQKFQQTAQWEPDNSEGFSMVKSFGKYEFKDVDWKKDIHIPRTLIITAFDKKPNDIPVLQTFYYPVRPVAFAVKQEIISYPIHEIGYVAVASK